ncbi:MAG: beta-ketoacyl synthase N-terminal-like domain-containing protein [Desulfobacterales bacterium]
MRKNDPIAVVGISGIFPGASDLDQFWSNLIHKRSAVDRVKPHRWAAPPEWMVSRSGIQDKAYTARSCHIPEFLVDADGLDIDPALLRELDPLYHFVLHTGKAALNQCRHALVDREKAGVCLAAIVLPTDSATRITRWIFGRDFSERLFTTAGSHPAPDRHAMLSARVAAFPAALLANALNLGGGAFTLDAACASSLYAVKLACDELRDGRADLMLAGGVSRPDALFTQVGFSQLKALSPSGRCAPFDERADGLVVGEGAGMLVLKRLSDSVRDKDTIYGIIRSIGLSNDMRGNLLAPDTEGQVRAMTRAYDAAGWRPDDVDLIECHGAGTTVGDRIELNSMMALWEGFAWSPGQCPIGSVKSAIGHLLTGAGVAGIIKTLMGLAHHTLPPSLNFTRPPNNSPLPQSPFRVQTEPEPWPVKKDGTPRRAAVSAFGFGGTNGHILLEEYVPSRKPDLPVEVRSENTAGRDCFEVREKHEPIAIIGMEALFGGLGSLESFQEAVFKGESAIRHRPESRWRGCDDLMERMFGLGGIRGNFTETFDLPFGRFHIPPREIPEILPQQLLMLTTAAGAMRDAGLAVTGKRPKMSALIGIGFDFETTGFHLRWGLHNQIERWNREYALNLSEQQRNAWEQMLMEEMGPPLTAAATIGNLGSIVASRIAREFQFGGPSYSVSNDDVSGLKALEIGVRSLQQGESDAVLVGAVDLFGDPRNLACRRGARPFAMSDRLLPFDERADGALPGEGAAALIIKRFSDAIEDGDRIYAVIRGVGKASNACGDTGCIESGVYARSMAQALVEADVSPNAVGLIEAHGSGDPMEDRVEIRAFHDFFGRRKSAAHACAIGTVKPVIGHTGAAAGLASVVKAALCAHRHVIAPVPGFQRAGEPIDHRRFHIPALPQYWHTDGSNQLRNALICAMTTDGNCMHVVLSEPERDTRNHRPEVSSNIWRERKRPVGAMPHGLFWVTAENKQGLIERLDTLSAFFSEPGNCNLPLEDAACRWHRSFPAGASDGVSVVIVTAERSRLEEWISRAKEAVFENRHVSITGPEGVCYSPNALGPQSRIAFVYPGSGNHYIGMGRDISLLWPEVIGKMERETASLKAQVLPHLFVPWRVNWDDGWEQETHAAIAANPLNMIIGQVAYGCMMTELIQRFTIRPDAVIGYSLGESTGYFALHVWQDRALMLDRMHASDLFTDRLAGPCTAVRRMWGLSPEQELNWCTAVVNRSVEDVQSALKHHPLVRCLIVNTRRQCVIGGHRPDVSTVVDALACEAVFLDGVLAVHSDAAQPAAKDYKALHEFPVNPPKNVTFYSCADGKVRTLTSRSAAESILKQALHGFDFTQTIEQAYADGIRIFIEMGPHASCTGMIRTILQGRPHAAASLSFRGESEYLSVLKCLAAVLSEGVPADLSALFSLADESPVPDDAVSAPSKKHVVSVAVGGPPPCPVPPGPMGTGRDTNVLRKAASTENAGSLPDAAETRLQTGNRSSGVIYRDLIAAVPGINEAASRAHETFLSLSMEIQKNQAQAFKLQNRLLEMMLRDPAEPNTAVFTKDMPADDAIRRWPQDIYRHGKAPYPEASDSIAFSRQMCMEFAVGSAAKVLGPEFAVIDTYEKRVRLPDEPLMLVDRILSITGEKCSLTGGKIVTEHDVAPQAWYLDGGKAPTCIAVEAGQADLFLCAYLGIDHRVKGQRVYRLLDATVEFHRGLPEPGDIIQYHIFIDRFVRQGETYLFFFNFEGYIRGEPLITMTNGCAGFFTEAEVNHSGGILRAPDEQLSSSGAGNAPLFVPVRFEAGTYPDHAVDSLRRGDAAACFGAGFEGVVIPENLRLPGGLMKLVDRVLHIDPEGGLYGLGVIRAEADIHPGDWFLTCHFKDDMVMPGTLMYECCVHTLRIFFQQIGWISDVPGAAYEPKTGIQAIMKCRGPVTPRTRHVHYEIDIKEMGYDPEPYAIADAHMFADGRCIVRFSNMSLKLSRTTENDVRIFWENHAHAKKTAVDAEQTAHKALYDRKHLLEFALGSPAKAFGPAYRPFEKDRFIARLPNPPYLFMDRIVRCEPRPWVLKPGGWIEAEFDVRPDHWYFFANRSDTMPFAVLLEIALQPCGWLAAFMGSALAGEKDLRFRNLDGKAVQYAEVMQERTTLTTRARCKQVSTAGDMIIESFEFAVKNGDSVIYSGETSFGFFTEHALEQQKGIRDAKGRLNPRSNERKGIHIHRKIAKTAPFFPNDPDGKRPTHPPQTPALPGKALLMIDDVQTLLPDGGSSGLGFIHGAKAVDPDEWVFAAHFLHDPVYPGSLGIEAFVQLLKFFALDRWNGLTDFSRFEMITGHEHRWSYRGQITPQNKKVVVEASVTERREDPVPSLTASGFLHVDGTVIYELDNFGIRAARNRS